MVDDSSFLEWPWVLFFCFSWKYLKNHWSISRLSVTFILAILSIWILKEGTSTFLLIFNFAKAESRSFKLAAPSYSNLARLFILLEGMAPGFEILIRWQKAVPFPNSSILWTLGKLVLSGVIDESGISVKDLEEGAYYLSAEAVVIRFIKH